MRSMGRAGRAAPEGDTMGFSWMIGIRFLTSRQKPHISFITIMAVVGVTIGVSALLIITGISSGFLDEFKEKVLGVNAHIIVLKVGETFQEYRDVTKAARREKGVVAAAPFIITEMMIVKDKSISGILIKGIDPAFAKQILDLPHNIRKGKLSSLELVPPAPGPPGPKEDDIDITDILDEESGAAGRKTQEKKKPSSEAGQLPGMIIGATLAENLHAGIGDTVKVISPMTGLDTSYMENKFDTSVSAGFRITGIFYSGFDEYDSRLVYVNLYQAQKLFNYGDSVTGVEMKVDDIDKAKEIAASLDSKLSGGLYRIIDWEELNHPLFTALFVQKIALTVVLMLSVLMASLNIISMLILFIMSKKRDISILKSMGATKRQITSIFMMIGVTAGAIGLAIGSVIGVGICKLLTAYGWRLDPKVYLIDHLPLSLSLTDYLVCVCITFLICIIFTVIPSLKAASLNPVEGIKYE
jgi:lipoprotein-releasing system permease protein